MPQKIDEMNKEDLLKAAKELNGVDEFNSKKHENPITVPVTQIMYLIEIKDALIKLAEKQK